jgi:hypothetical protein
LEPDFDFLSSVSAIGRVGWASSFIVRGVPRTTESRVVDQFETALKGHGFSRAANSKK